MVPRTGVSCSARPDYSNDPHRCKLAASPPSNQACLRASPVAGPAGINPPGTAHGRGVISLTFWQKCVWVGAALVIVVSLLVITRTAETSGPAGHSAGQAEYFSFQDNTRSETHYAVRDGDRAVV